MSCTAAVVFRIDHRRNSVSTLFRPAWIYSSSSSSAQLFSVMRGCAIRYLCGKYFTQQCPAAGPTPHGSVHVTELDRVCQVHGCVSLCQIHDISRDFMQCFVYDVTSRALERGDSSFPRQHPVLAGHSAMGIRAPSTGAHIADNDDHS